MNKAVKWILAIAGLTIAMIVIAVIVLPMVIDVQKYKPQIEQQVAKATGRSFRLGGDIEPSFFPWIGVRLSDLHLGNPAGSRSKISLRWNLLRCVSSFCPCCRATSKSNASW